jgi:plasmid stabilization system protein ParE
VASRGNKTYRIRWAPVALQDLDEIIDYVASQDGTGAAASLFSKIKKRCGALSRHPARCRIVPELKSVGVTEYRELIVSPYRVFFRVYESEVGIVGVLDGRRDLEETLIRRAMR